MPIGRKRLTARTVETLRPAAPDPTGKRNGRRFVMDAEVSGLGVKVTETGSRSYVLIKRFPGFKHPAPRQLGSCDVLSLEEAREKARDWLKLIARGVDPAQHERELQEAAARKRENSFAAVAEDFFGRSSLANGRAGTLSATCARNSSPPGASGRSRISPTRTFCRLYVRSSNVDHRRKREIYWATRAAFSIGRSTSEAMASSPIHVQGLNRRAWSGKSAPGERVLTDDELFAFWRVTGHMGYPAGPLYRLLILTGLRLNEVADAKWSEFDLRNGVWIVPAARMKGKDGRAADHVVPITDDIAAILESLPRFKSGDYLFSVTFGKTPVWVSDKIKKRLDTRMLRTLRRMARRRGDDPSRVTLPPWVNHDLRRTLRTGLSKLRIDRDIREAVLAHTRPGVEGVYDRHDYLDEKQDALERWAFYVRNLSSHEVEATNIVRLRG